MRCGVPAPENIGRCVLTAGHTGQHWNAGGEWIAKTNGSEPMHGTLKDVRALQDAVRVAAVALALEGVPLPPEVADHERRVERVR